jgi:transketolase
MYCFPAVRLSAISYPAVVSIMTHGSIALGADGRILQLIEVLSLCRASTNLLVCRPADGDETTGSYIAAMNSKAGRLSSS